MQESESGDDASESGDDATNPWTLITLASIGALFLLVIVEEGWGAVDYYIGSGDDRIFIDREIYFLMWLGVGWVFLVGFKRLTKDKVD